ncbi:hypothetical protein GOBAR_AA17996 [Gossypium barbadense]|uniref:Uncharacterized protein n=1 Tax=Gossypium barbadense TaxID=3634 RepID=A0A2P5XHA5_GOSBA|nr:hypothetical protein GOBAR_AA17996 [Gossypium barbadense]
MAKGSTFGWVRVAVGIRHLVAKGAAVWVAKVCGGFGRMKCVAYGGDCDDLRVAIDFGKEKCGEGKNREGATKKGV